MIEWIIRRSVANRFLVMMAALFLSIWAISCNSCVPCPGW